MNTIQFILEILMLMIKKKTANFFFPTLKIVQMLYELNKLIENNQQEN